MVNIDEGPLIRLCAVPSQVSWLPRSKGGKPIAVETLYRWARVGVLNAGRQRIKLEVLGGGEGLTTNEAALHRFYERTGESEAVQISPTPTQQKRAHQVACAKLRAMGV